MKLANQLSTMTILYVILNLRASYLHTNRSRLRTLRIRYEYETYRTKFVLTKLVQIRHTRRAVHVSIQNAHVNDTNTFSQVVRARGIWPIRNKNLFILRLGIPRPRACTFPKCELDSPVKGFVVASISFFSFKFQS